MNALIRAERAGDPDAIRTVVSAAFEGNPHSDGSEPGIVDRLRQASDLAVSLVAEDCGTIVGHVAISPVIISDGSVRWFGLGPVAVAPARQRQGIGTGLVARGLELLRQNGAGGCVVLGDPEFYSRFGFRHDARLSFPGPPSEFFQALPLAGATATGTVSYAPAFG